MITPHFAMVKWGVEHPDLWNLFTAVKRLLKNLHQPLEISSCISIVSHFAAAPFLSDCIICLISFGSVVTNDCTLRTCFCCWCCFPCLKRDCSSSLKGFPWSLWKGRKKQNHAINKISIKVLSYQTLTSYYLPITAYLKKRGFDSC